MIGDIEESQIIKYSLIIFILLGSIFFFTSDYTYTNIINQDLYNEGEQWIEEARDRATSSVVTRGEVFTAYEKDERIVVAGLPSVGDTCTRMELKMNKVKNRTLFLEPETYSTGGACGQAVTIVEILESYDIDQDIETVEINYSYYLREEEKSYDKVVTQVRDHTTMPETFVIVDESDPLYLEQTSTERGDITFRYEFYNNQTKDIENGKIVFPTCAASGTQRTTDLALSDNTFSVQKGKVVVGSFTVKENMETVNYACNVGINNTEDVKIYDQVAISVNEE